jgi:hypothetical protein
MNCFNFRWEGAGPGAAPSAWCGAFQSTASGGSAVLATPEANTALIVAGIVAAFALFRSARTRRAG